MDPALLAELATVVQSATDAFEAYDYTGALEVTERFFWSFCDDYLVLVKERAYGSADVTAAGSARATLALTLDVVLRLFAPILPFATEEVRSLVEERVDPPGPMAGGRRGGHRGRPVRADRRGGSPDRHPRAKSQAKVSMKTQVTAARFSGTAESVQRLRLVEGDLRGVGRLIGDVAWSEGEGPVRVEVTLAEAPA